MKYIIASDIHGSAYWCKKLIDVIDEVKPDEILLLGDILYHGPRNDLPEDYSPKKVIAMLNPLADKITSCRGNCDAEVDQMLLEFPCLSDYALVMDEGKRLFLTHGHIYNEEKMPKGKTDLFFYGHTHLWKLEKSGDHVVCNVGSISLPKGGNPPTYAMYEAGQIEVFNLDNREILASLSL